jgi:hypothetical protein
MAYPHTDAKNIRVYGGLFQWGRKDVLHALRDAVNDVPGSFTSIQYTISNYNPASTDQKFVWELNLANYWWLSDDCNASNLWGNGGGLSTQTNFSQNSGTPIATPANHYNPCPSGYRVPTQHEWALISNEGGSSSSFDNDNFSPLSIPINVSSSGTTWYVPLNNQKVVWVRVSDGKPSLEWTVINPKISGYALYNANDEAINTTNERNAVFNPNNDLTLSSAPDPLMFLPAAGGRDYSTGRVIGTISNGKYWSSTVTDKASFYMFFSDEYVRVYSGTWRAHGHSVRCIKEL